jgi:hypothetical protein
MVCNYEIVNGVQNEHKKWNYYQFLDLFGQLFTVACGLWQNCSVHSHLWPMTELSVKMVQYYCYCIGFKRWLDSYNDHQTSVMCMLHNVMVQH